MSQRREIQLWFEDCLSLMESTWWCQSYFFQTILMKREWNQSKTSDYVSVWVSTTGPVFKRCFMLSLNLTSPKECQLWVSERWRQSPNTYWDPCMQAVEIPQRQWNIINRGPSPWESLAWCLPQDPPGLVLHWLPFLIVFSLTIMWNTMNRLLTCNNQMRVSKISRIVLYFFVQPESLLALLHSAVWSVKLILCDYINLCACFILFSWFMASGTVQGFWSMDQSKFEIFFYNLHSHTALMSAHIH